jgi:multidrug efflux pump subunit AcrA (membrane-fusion protein)
MSTATQPAKAINLRVRPLQSVDVSFPVDGIVANQTDIHLLGKPVAKFDLTTFYPLLGTVLSPKMKPEPPGVRVVNYAQHPLQPLGWGRLRYDSEAIRDYMRESILFELRAEQTKAALDKAVAQRENIWVQKYERAVYDATQRAYDRNDPNSKVNRLKRLAAISLAQHDRLKAEYDASFNKDGGTAFKDGVVREIVTTNKTSSANSKTEVKDSRTTLQSYVNDGQLNTSGSSESYARGPDFRHPGLENDAQFERAQISLLDEQLSAVSVTNYACGSKLERDASPDPDPGGLSHRYLANDLAAIDLDIKRLQVAYMDTILVSPIDGVVTGVFRNTGDSVRATQPVVRIENDLEIFLVGTLKYRGLLQVGQDITVSTSLFDTTEAKSVTGKVAAVRGHDSENELWDVLILCANRVAGQAIFPINYNFDFDNTEVTVAV